MVMQGLMAANPGFSASAPHIQTAAVTTSLVSLEGCFFGFIRHCLTFRQI